LFTNLLKKTNILSQETANYIWDLTFFTSFYDFIYTIKPSVLLK